MYVREEAEMFGILGREVGAVRVRSSAHQKQMTFDMNKELFHSELLLYNNS